MPFTTLKIPGADAVRLLNEHRQQFPATGRYPFLIGDAQELDRLMAAAEFNTQHPPDIIQASLAVNTADWFAQRRKAEAEFQFSEQELLGEWPGEILEKGSIGLHRDILTRKIQREVFLGLAPIDQSWKLPAVLRFGDWNDCPPAEVHCALHRAWQERFAAEITGVSGDVIECLVNNPPTTPDAATRLAWEHYWYCADIVDQGCGTISNLAATLLNSPYWYFWWD